MSLPLKTTRQRVIEFSLRGSVEVAEAALLEATRGRTPKKPIRPAM